MPVKIAEGRVLMILTNHEVIPQKLARTATALVVEIRSG